MGKKILDFEEFCKVAELMQNKAHLTQSGLEEIRIIKAGMNTGRKSPPGFTVNSNPLERIDAK